MAELVLQANVRETQGKKSRALRRAGSIPGIYYAHGEENVMISIPERSLRPLLLTKEAHIVNLQLDNGKSLNCVLREVQYDPITDKPVHLDLQGIKADEELTIDIPVLLIGIPVGVKNGGMLQHVLHKVRVACLPKYIPEHVNLDVSGLEINHSIHVRDLSIENVRFLDNAENAIVAVIPPAAVVEEAAPVAEAEVPAEPEVIGKGKKIEEEAEEPKKEEKKKEEKKP